MLRKLALKELTDSDLTLFESHFRKGTAGNQKAINLNADVFVSKLYPSLPAIAIQHGGRIPLELSIYGPGLGPEYSLQRKIIKHGTYKNWRLDGEFIYSPSDDLNRFNPLGPGDFAILEFSGDPQPLSCRAFFVARAVPEDQSLHGGLTSLIGDSSMTEITYTQIEETIENTKPASNHPVRDLLLEIDLEEASVGISTGVDRLLSRPSHRRMDAAAFQRARDNADAVGQLGEEHVNVHLEQLLASGALESFEWVSQNNVIAPYDFRVTPKGKPEVLVDVKSTEGDFERPMHVSMNEVKQMATGPLRYDLYRMYEVSETGARLRVAEDLRDFGLALLDSLKALPQGVVPDGFSFAPKILKFGLATESQPPKDEV